MYLSPHSALCHPEASKTPPASHFPRGSPEPILAGFHPLLWGYKMSALRVGKDPQSPCANQETLPPTQRKYVARLEELREALENSPFFKTHEVGVLAAVGAEGPVWGAVGGVSIRVAPKRNC